MHCIIILFIESEKYWDHTSEMKKISTKEKEIIGPHKYFATNADAGDSGYTTSPDTQEYNDCISR